MKNTIISIICLVLASAASYGQQSISYTQFIMNKQQLNPGYTGYRETLNATMSHRSQWIGFKGAPSTQILSFDTPLKKGLAVGASLIHDKIGPTSELSISTDIAYRVRVRRQRTFSFALKASGSLYQSRLDQVALTSDYYGIVDEDFVESGEKFIIPNIGFGFYYYTGKTYFGVSSPKMLRMKMAKKGTIAYEQLNGTTEPTYYLMAGHNYKINRVLRVQPNFISQFTVNSPLSLGVHLNFIYMKEFTTGVFYHFGESAGAIVQWQFDKKWKVGYSIEIAANNLIKTNFGSHEIIINYTMKQKRNRVVFPRYF